nr:MAG TPA: hypothetical protein [Caudoviricetes sp.]
MNFRHAHVAAKIIKSMTRSGRRRASARFSTRRQP